MYYPKPAGSMQLYMTLLLLPTLHILSHPALILLLYQQAHCRQHLYTSLQIYNPDGLVQALSLLPAMYNMIRYEYAQIIRTRSNSYYAANASNLYHHIYNMHHYAHALLYRRLIPFVQKSLSTLQQFLQKALSLPLRKNLPVNHKLLYIVCAHTEYLLPLFHQP